MIFMADIVQAVAREFRVPVEAFREPRPANKNKKCPLNPHTISRPRQVAMYLADRLTGRSYSNIGRYFGGRDHSTVIYAIRKVEERRTRDPQLAGRLEQLEWEILP